MVVNQAQMEDFTRLVVVWDLCSRDPWTNISTIKRPCISSVGYTLFGAQIGWYESLPIAIRTCAKHWYRHDEL